MRLLAFAASLRRESLNRKLIQLAVDLAREAKVEVDHADFHEFDMPLYDADLQNSSGFPAGSRELARRVEAADGAESEVYGHCASRSRGSASPCIPTCSPWLRRNRHWTNAAS